MIEKSDLYKNLPNKTLSDYFRNAGDLLAEEAIILGGVIRSILAYDGQVTNKAIILRLINLMENTEMSSGRTFFARPWRSWSIIRWMIFDLCTIGGST